MAYVIAEPCVDVHDRGCVDECPVDGIYDGLRKSYVHPDECVDCGACEPVCPVTAIFNQDDLPDAWRGYQQIEREFWTRGSRTSGAPEAPPRSAIRTWTIRSSPRSRSSSTPDTRW